MACPPSAGSSAACSRRSSSSGSAASRSGATGTPSPWACRPAGPWRELAASSFTITRGASPTSRWRCASLAGPRHDLGLYEAVVLFAIAGVALAPGRGGGSRGASSGCSPSSTAAPGSCSTSSGRATSRTPTPGTPDSLRPSTGRSSSSPGRLAPGAAPSRPASEIGRCGARASGRYLNGVPILVVEDDPGIRQGIADFLGFEGYAVDVAAERRGGARVSEPARRPSLWSSTW